MARCINFYKTEETDDTVTYTIENTNIECSFLKCSRDSVVLLDHSDWRICALITRVRSVGDIFPDVLNWSS